MSSKRQGDGNEDEEPPKKNPRLDSTATVELELPQLLDFSNITTLPDVTTRFDEIAKALLHEYRISVSCNGKVTELEILELEFYLQKAGCHEDPFTHGSEEQRQSGRWYFHRSPTYASNSPLSQTAAGGYRGGSRKGVDLTIGRPVAGTSTSQSNTSILRGGVLLRTIRRVSDSKVISGPSLLVDEILRLHGASSIEELVSEKWAGNIAAFPSGGDIATPSISMYLRRITSTSSGGVKQSTLQFTGTSNSAKPHIYQSPRIGLDLSNPHTTSSPTHPRVVFVSKRYRYFTQPHLLTANGRGHTFLGVYQTCLESGKFDGAGRVAALKRELGKVTGIKEATLVKYLADYKAGLDSGVLKTFVGATGKGAGSSPSSFLNMMGTLERVRSE